MTRHNLKYNRYDYPQGAIQAAERLFADKPWRMDVGVNAAYRSFAEDACAAYDIESPEIILTGTGEIGYGYVFVPGEGPKVFLPRESITSLFCAIGHHLHAFGGVLHSSEDSGIEAVRWGYSLFYTVKPVMFRRRVREGRIQGMTAKDTFSRETWDQLVYNGLTSGDFLLDPHLDIRTLESEDDLVNPSDIEEADDAQELAPVIELPTVDPELQALLDEENEIQEGNRMRLIEFLKNEPITNLRKLSRGHVRGGYSMTKPALVAALADNYDQTVVELASQMGINWR